MANIDPAPSWANIRRLETTDRNMAGPGGILNDPTTSIAARLNLLRDNDTALGSSIAAVNARQDAADTAIANIQGQVLNAPGTLSDLDHGAPISVTGDQFPDVLSIYNSRGPVLALNESVAILAQRDEWLKAQTLSLVSDKVSTVSTISELRSTLAAVAGPAVSVRAYRAGMRGGGGLFYWDPLSVAQDDGGAIIKVASVEVGRWVREVANGVYTPEMWGCSGVGAAGNDGPGFQAMLNHVPAGGVVWLDPAKTYYNGFGAGNANTWTRNRPITIQCNGATLTRATPVKSVDEQSAVLRLTGAGPFHIVRPRIDGNNPVGYWFTNPGVQRTDGYQIALCQCIDYGIHLSAASNVHISDAEIFNCAFNVWSVTVDGLRLSGYLHHSGQVVNNIIFDGDKALGAGIKLSNTTHFNIDVRGYRNANGTVEIEAQNRYGKVSSISEESVSNNVVIYDSSDIEFTAITRGSERGCGANLTRGKNNFPMRNISGTVISESCGDTGLRVYVNADATQNMEQVSLTVQTRGCTNNGADIRNYSTGGMVIDGLFMQYDGKDNCTALAGNDLWIYGDVRGKVTGRSKGCYCGVIMNGTNNPDKGFAVAMDLSEVASIAYSQGATFTADLFGTKTSVEMQMVSNVPRTRIARSNVSGGTRAYDNLVLHGSLTYLLGLPSGVPAFANAAYRATDTDGNYIVKLKS